MFCLTGTGGRLVYVLRVTVHLMPQWRYWLVDLPARAMDAWARVYWALLTLMCAIIFGTLVWTVVADQFAGRTRRPSPPAPHAAPPVRSVPPG